MSLADRRAGAAPRRKQSPVITDDASAGPKAGRPAALLAWYDRHRRVLPWRPPAGTPADPYAVWLSEIMLQQTTVRAVGPYFEKFRRAGRASPISAKPRSTTCCGCGAGLGYYSRARNLHACAVAVAPRPWRGDFPTPRKACAQLPGIGPYTAAAIARDRLRPSGPCRSTAISSASTSRLYAVEERAAAGQAAHPGTRARHCSAPSRAGDSAQALDGSRFFDLHAEEARLRAMSA